MSFFCSRIQRYNSTCGHHVSVSPCCDGFFFHLFLMALMFWKKSCQVLCRLSINSHLSDVFSWFNWAYVYFRKENPRSEVLLFYQIKGVCDINMIYIIGDVHLDYLDKCWITGFSTVKYSFPLRDRITKWSLHSRWVKLHLRREEYQKFVDIC